MKHQFYFILVFKQFWRSWLNRLGLTCVAAIFFIAIFAPLLANDKPLYLKYHGQKYYPALGDLLPVWQNRDLAGLDLRGMKLEAGEKRVMPVIPYSPTEYNLDTPLMPPGQTHWLGTDEQGRDVAARLIFGTRVSLAVGFIAVGIYFVIGLIVGAIAGYYGGIVDILVQRVIEIVMCFPTFFLILTVLAFVGPSIFNIMIVIGLTGWTGIARLVRAEFLKLRNQDFVTAIRAAGARPARIMFRHILPNALAPVLVSLSFGVASSILAESSLSFLGFGVQPPTPSWGDTLSQARDFMDIAWWLTIFPGLAIFITLTAFNLVGEGLRDAIDPKMKT